MTLRPSFQLSRLREIGWSKWDPIGLGGSEDWPADEYDGYLVEAAGQLWRGASEEEVATYLVEIETAHMGISAVANTHSRALNVVKSIREYVETLRT